MTIRMRGKHSNTDLDLARSLAGTLYVYLDYRNSDFEFVIDRTLAHDLAEARARAQDVNITLDNAHDFASYVNGYLDRDPYRALAGAQALVNALEISRAFARESVDANAIVNVQAFAFELCDRLESALALAESNRSGQRRTTKSGRVIVSPLARRVIGTAVRCLPATQRARYREEYHAELHEMASVSRRAQWRYATNLLICAVPLRRALRRTEGKPAPNRWPG